jgi:NAD(P)-dependent dehydrogenase (short-subunit alcohol dehydrogenase family)
MGLLDGKVVAMTGAGGALGGAYAQAMAKAGASIAVSDIRIEAARATAAAIAAAGSRSIAIQTDVTDAEAMDELVDRTERELGPLDVFVNVAGIYPRSLLAEMTEQEWDQVIQVNLKSVFLGTRAALRRMLPRRRGVIVSVASGTGLRGARDGGAHYAASKAGIIGLTRSVAREVKDAGIRINCVGPGATESGLWRVGKSEDEVQRLLAGGGIHQPADFAEVVVFLASDSSWPLTGEFIAREI